MIHVPAVGRPRGTLSRRRVFSLCEGDDVFKRAESPILASVPSALPDTSPQMGRPGFEPGSLAPKASIIGQTKPSSLIVIIFRSLQVV